MNDVARLKAAFTCDFTVTKRPEPVPGDLRVGWGQSLLLLVLASSRGQRCSLQKVHFLAHLSRTVQLRQLTREVIARLRNPVELSIRIEPWVNRAAAFGIANGLVTSRDGKSLALTCDGKATVKVLRAAGVLADETAFLDEIGKLATEEVVDSIMKMEAF